MQVGCQAASCKVYTVCTMHKMKKCIHVVRTLYIGE
jgi:hypothetical protein